MAINKDLRVVKTRRALISTMLLLLRDVPFNKITVNDLCMKSLVSRSAFYTHFMDKYDLLNQSLDAISSHLFGKAEHENVRTQIRLMLDVIHQDNRLFKNLLMAEYDAELMALLRKGLMDRFFQHQQRGDTELAFPYPQELSVACCAAGFTTAIMLWISDNMQYSVDEVFDCVWALMPKNA